MKKKNNNNKNNNIITQLYKDYLIGFGIHFQQIFRILNSIFLLVIYNVKWLQYFFDT